MLKKRPFDATDVRQVTVRVATSEAALVNNREMPDISLQHMVAVMLLDKTASFRAAHDKPRMDNADVRRVRATVQLIPDPDLEARMPRREATVTVVLADGTRLTEHVDAVRGTAENPMLRAEVVAKCRDLMAPILGPARCNTLIDRVLTLESTNDVRTIGPLLQPA
jgi:2-methylcitrate dehydratase PrpD